MRLRKEAHQHGAANDCQVATYKGLFSAGSSTAGGEYVRRNVALYITLNSDFVVGSFTLDRWD
jgi:hypothetical protein